jgi:hypothetical protein
MARTVRARSTDPVTSHLAADSVDNVTATQAYILRCLKRPRNDTQLIDAYRAYKTAPRASESGIRSRRAELVDRGLVADTGFRVLLNSGRYSIVWGLSNV